MFIHTFETVTFLNNEKYYNIQTSLQSLDKDKWKIEKDGILYWGLSDKGILINLRKIKKKGFYSYCVIYTISARRVIDNDNFIGLFNTDNYDELEDTVNALLKDKCKDLPKLKACNLTRIDFCFNIALKNQDQVKTYLHTIKRGNIPPGYDEFVLYDKVSKRSKPSKNDFTFGKKGYVEISIYNKYKQMKNDSKYFSKEEIERASNILRMEIRCKKKLLKKLYKNYNISGIRGFMKKADKIGNELYNEFLVKISGSGDIYTLKETYNRIDMSEFRQKDIKRMKSLVKDANNSRSTTDILSDYENTYSKAVVKRMLELFEIIDTSFITVPVRDAKLFEYNKLPSPLKLYREIC